MLMRASPIISLTPRAIKEISMHFQTLRSRVAILVYLAIVHFSAHNPFQVHPLCVWHHSAANHVVHTRSGVSCGENNCAMPCEMCGSTARSWRDWIASLGRTASLN